MTKVGVNLGNNQVVGLSQTRLNALLEGNQQALQRMGWFDTLKDQLFRGGAKQAGLIQLAKEFDAYQGRPSVDRFIQLSRFADPVDRGQFSLSIGGPANAPVATFRIRDLVVKTDPVSPQTLNSLNARLGVAENSQRSDLTYPADWLGQFERQNLRAERQALDDSAFREGGVHKRFHPGSGILRAEDKTGSSDFKRENLIAELATEHPDLARYVSTQKAIPKDEMSEILPNIKSDKSHATVTLYDPNHVRSGELDKEITSLSLAEARSVLMQTVDLARVLYKNGVSHQDLHMHNLMVYRPTIPEQGNVTLKAIDFGKSKTNISTESDRLNDIRYLFHKKASSGEIETLRRNMRDTFGYDQIKQEKHYPLHKLMSHCVTKASSAGASVREPDATKNSYDPLLSAIGDALIKRLITSEQMDGETKIESIDAAFDDTMIALANSIDNLTRPTIEPYFIRG